MSENKQYYLIKDVKYVNETRGLQANISWSSSDDLYIYIYITKWFLINYPYTEDIVEHSNEIYGP